MACSANKLPLKLLPFKAKRYYRFQFFDYLTNSYSLKSVYIILELSSKEKTPRFLEVFNFYKY